jgi:hypothetical protein
MFERAAVSKKRWRASVKTLLFSGLIYPISQLAPLGRFISFAFGLNVAKRYDRLFEIIDRYKCHRIMEIGTYDGEHAKQMIETAKKHFPANEVEYYGFDLFELLDEHKLKEELSKKPPPYHIVKRKLEETGAKIFLFKGDTREVLPRVVNTLPTMDFIFIDGGHSLKTIESDWRYAQAVMGPNTIVVFDDYWNRFDAGCKALIDALDRANFDVEILPPKDRFLKEDGFLEINLAKVTRKHS